MDDKEKWLLPLRIIILVSSGDLLFGDFGFKIEQIYSISNLGVINSTSEGGSGCTDIDIGEEFLAENAVDSSYKSQSNVSLDRQKQINLKNKYAKFPNALHAQKANQKVNKRKRARGHKLKPLQDSLKIYCPGCRDNLKLENTLLENNRPQRCSKCQGKIAFLCLWCDGMYRNSISAQNHCNYSCKKRPPVKIVLTRTVSSELGKLEVEERVERSKENCKLEKTIEELHKRLAKKI